MVRRSLGVALWTLVGLLACVLGSFSALVGTRSGRNLLAQISAGALHQVFSGTVEVGDATGSLITGVSLREVRLFDADTTLVAWLPQVDIHYDPLDFTAGRVVLLGFDLRRPVINIVEHPSGRLNVEELLRLGGPDRGPPGLAPLILFHNVRITDGSVTLRLQARRPEPGDSSLEIASGTPDGRLRIRRFEHLNAQFRSVQVSSPAERGIRIDVVRLAVESDDPTVRLVDVAGTLRVVGNSVELALTRVRLPASTLTDTRGLISWPHDTLLFDLRVRARAATLRDVRFIESRFAGRPGAGVFSGDVRVRSHGTRLLEVDFDPLRLADGGGTVVGRLTALSGADTGLLAVRDADLEAHDFDLAFARAFVPGLPFVGRLTGHTTATGPLSALALEADWTFRDSLVAGWPESHVRGKGQLNLAAPDGIHFQPFAVEASSVALSTVARLAPAVLLHGRLAVVGTLTGPLDDAQFTGTLEHHDGTRPASRVTGATRLDFRRDTLVIDADVTADSLSFDDLRGTFPALPLRGSVAGPVRLAGPLGALRAHLDLHGPAGGVGVDGTWMLDLPHYGARALAVAAHDVDLAGWLDNAPETRLNLRVEATGGGDSAVAPTGVVTAALGPSEFAGAALDSGHARVRFADQRLYVDSLRVAGPGLITSGSGSLGWTPGTHGQLAIDFAADSLNSLDPVLSWILGSGAAAGADPPGDPGDRRALAGSAHLVVTLGGSLDSLGLDARASADWLEWRGWTFAASRARVVWHPGVASTVEFDATLDSVAHGVLGFAHASVAARGTRDSVTWFARSHVGDQAAVLAGGRAARRAGPGGAKVVAVGVDSLALQVPGDVWVLEHPIDLTVTDSAAALSPLTLRSVYASGRLVLEGDFPTRGHANAHLQLEGFPLAGVYALFEQDTTGVGGTITVTAGLTGTRASPVSSGAFSLTNGSLQGFRAPFVDGTYDYHDRWLRGALHLWRAGQQILNVDITLPLDLALVATPHRQLPDTLSVRATADSVDLSVLGALTPSVRGVTGVFSADVGIAGTWDDPRLRGALEISQASATLPALHVRYEDVHGELALSGDSIAIRSLSARSEKGRADVTGVVRLEQLTHPVLELKIAADRFKALDLKNDVAITASGRLALTGPVFGATLTGDAKVTDGELYFADLVQKRIVNLDELADTSLASLIVQQSLGPEFQSVFLDSLRIDDLALDMGSDVWLRSNEANIQLAGSVRLTKRREVFLISGTLQATHGTYRLKLGPVSRDFVVTRGTVSYFGTPDQDAALDIEATHLVRPVPTPSQKNPEDLTIVAHITGTLLVPKVTLSAEQRDLSQTEAISYLLFGTSSVDLGGEQGGIADQRAVVQSALAVVSGEIEQTIVSGGVPVDYVEIRPSGGGQGAPLLGGQFAVGGQLGPKTFLVVSAGFCEGRQIAVGNMLGVSLQFRISPEWRTEASFAPEDPCAYPATDPLSTTLPRQVGLDLFWERHY